MPSGTSTGTIDLSGAEADDIVDGVGVVGAGPVALSVAHALNAIGKPPLLIASRTLSSAQRVARSLHAVTKVETLALGDTPPGVAEQVRLVIVALSDVALSAEAVGPQIHALFPHASLAVHTSGSLPASCLAGAAPFVLSMHPAVPFPRDMPTSLEGVLTAIEGDPAARPKGFRLAKALGMVPFVLDNADSKPLYHAACVTAANGAAVATAAAMELIRASAPSADVSVSAELVRDLACRAAMAVGVAAARGARPGDALTGPISRGDTQAVRAHVQAITSGRRSTSLEHFAEDAYKRLADLSIDVASSAGRISADTAEEFRKFIGSAG